MNFRSNELCVSINFYNPRVNCRKWGGLYLVGIERRSNPFRIWHQLCLLNIWPCRLWSELDESFRKIKVALRAARLTIFIHRDKVKSTVKTTWKVGNIDIECEFVVQQVELGI
jgi:hypothetical protein